jgi:uncharacterized protein with HEPN domain
MKSTPTHVDYVQDILDSIEKTAHFVEGMSFEDFGQDDKTAYAVLHALQIIGEATKQLPQPIRDGHPEVPWREMAGMRDKVIHHYRGVNRMLVWKTAIEDLPKLEPMIRDILAETRK